jgi:hypothetical protein|tara:strand:+ start:448 stop:579 length:132 start_codon:yes stop_codon:yes gene_type:complete
MMGRLFVTIQSDYRYLPLTFDEVLFVDELWLVVMPVGQINIYA